MKLTGSIPFKWPFPPPPRSQSPGRSGSQRGVGKRAGGKHGVGLSRKAMVVDVVLVVLWGASIPGLMWLGAAGGF